MSNTKLIQVCELNECEQKPEEVTVKNKRYTFCCIKGFEKSLKEFEDSLKHESTM